MSYSIPSYYYTPTHYYKPTSPEYIYYKPTSPEYIYYKPTFYGYSDDVNKKLEELIGKYNLGKFSDIPYPVEKDKSILNLINEIIKDL